MVGFRALDISLFVRLQYSHRRSEKDGPAVIGYEQAFQPRSCFPSKAPHQMDPTGQRSPAAHKHAPECAHCVPNESLSVGGANRALWNPMHSRIDGADADA